MSSCPDDATERPVSAQNWTELDPPPLGDWTPSLSVTVILPAKDCQPELDKTLSSLAQQTYPAHLLETIVVDDDSTVPLTLGSQCPADTRIVRLPAATGHGSGRGRHAGAREAKGEILLFLDADMVASRRHVEAHARWHHVSTDAVVLGRKFFVDLDHADAAEVGDAVARDQVDHLLHGGPRLRHVWQENMIRAQGNLTTVSDDTFLCVVGASVSLRSGLYSDCGGFGTMGLRGIVDTEFGYRAFTSGGVIIPEMEAPAYHQGLRNFAVRGDEIKRERAGIAANHLPIPLFRPADVGRQWSVPSIRVIVPVGSQPAEVALITVDSLLASRYTDLRVTVATDQPPPQWLVDYYAVDGRVELATGAVTSGFPSPYTAVVPAGLVVTPDTVTRLRQALYAHGVGVVSVHVDDDEERHVELWLTRALHRARRHQRGYADLEHAARDLFGQRWLAAGSVGVEPAHPMVTRQGMVVDRRVDPENHTWVDLPLDADPVAPSAAPTH